MTKKILLAAVLLLSTTLFSFSQDKKSSDNRKYIFGLKTGANFSWYKPDSRNLSEGGLKPGFSYGIMGDYVFQQNYAISAEFLVSTINGKMKFKDPLTYHKIINSKDSSFKVPNVQYEYSVRYIQVPFSFKFRTKEIGAMKYFAQFGVAPGIRVSSKTQINGNGMPWDEDERANIKTNKDSEESYEPSEFDDDVSLINIPLIIGAGVEYNISGNTSLYSNLRYENGFTNILRSKTGTETIAFSKNIALSVGVFF